MAQTLPTIRKPEDIVNYLKIWQGRLLPLVKRIASPRAPWGFNATGKRGGIYLTWRNVTGADGYELQRADDILMTSNIVNIKLKGANITSHFDAVGPTSGGTTTKTYYYRIRATAGNEAKPQSVEGLWTVAISAETIDPTDTSTVRTPVYDFTTSDSYQAFIRRYQGNRW